MQYYFNFVRAQAVIVNLGSANQKLKALLEQQDIDVRNAVRQWDSEAEKQYKAAKARWDAAADQLPVILTGASQTLSGVSDLLFRTENQNAASWQR